MSFFSWPNCPPEVTSQVNRLVEAIQEAIGVNLEGIYLHGSLAMDCFNPGKSDLDIIVITQDGMNVNAKRMIIENLLVLSKQPCPIEISFISNDHLHPWKYPTPYDLHYSEMWRESMINQLKNQEWRNWNREIHKDPDLAAHITVILNRGICLYGRSIKEVFPTVPQKDYLASILLDYNDTRKNIPKMPMYAVLTFCRIVYFILEKGVASKREGALWGMKRFPEFSPTIERALLVYQGDAEEQILDINEILIFDRFIYTFLCENGFM
ncbi:MAG: aminoglycoside adenylyltransferase domain-containing protein [Clostridia bacterium]|jgi:predicted nucleotidyltransferase